MAICHLAVKKSPQIFKNSISTVVCADGSSFFSRLYENKGEADFRESLLQLFKSINEMMSSNSDQTVIVKVGAFHISIFASQTTAKQPE